MTTIDLGKQVGPLPLGAWIVVVGAGLGIAYYTRRTATPVVVEDTSGVPGVGTGEVGGWVGTQPAGGTGQYTPPTITTNEEWARAAINWLLAHNYPANAADSAIRKYMSGVQPSVQEYAMIAAVLVALGSPPQPLPPDEGPPSTGDSESRYATVLAGWHVDEWINDVRAGGLGYEHPDFSYSMLIAMNPQAVANIVWESARTGNTTNNYFRNQAIYRVR